MHRKKKKEKKRKNTQFGFFLQQAHAAILRPNRASYFPIGDYHTRGVQDRVSTGSKYGHREETQRVRVFLILTNTLHSLMLP